MILPRFLKTITPFRSSLLHSFKVHENQQFTSLRRGKWMQILYVLAALLCVKGAHIYNFGRSSFRQQALARLLDIFERQGEGARSLRRLWLPTLWRLILGIVLWHYPFSEVSHQHSLNFVSRRLFISLGGPFFPFLLGWSTNNAAPNPNPNSNPD